MADYGKDILEILLKVPDGLSIRKIVRHVYNMHNSLFETVDLEDVKRDVTNYLTNRSRSPQSPIQKTAERGVYRLNPKSEECKELQLQFKDFEEEEKLQEIVQDTSLDMFEGMY